MEQIGESKAMAWRALFGLLSYLDNEFTKKSDLECGEHLLVCGVNVEWKEEKNESTISRLVLEGIFHVIFSAPEGYMNFEVTFSVVRRKLDVGQIPTARVDLDFYWYGYSKYSSKPPSGWGYVAVHESVEVTRDKGWYAWFVPHWPKPKS